MLREQRRTCLWTNLGWLYWNSATNLSHETGSSYCKKEKKKETLK